VANFLAEDQQEPASSGGMGSLFPPLPAHESHATTESGSSTPVASPEYTKAIGAVQDTGTQQADATEAKGLNDADVAAATQEEAKQQLAEMDKMRAEKVAESNRQNENIKAQADVLRKANQELKATPAPALFHEGDGWKNVAKALALAVAGFGDALSAKGAALGGRSPSQNSVGNIVNMLVDQEKEKIAKLKDNQLIAKTGLKDAIDARSTALAEVDARGAEAMRRAQMLGDYMVKAAGPQGAVLKARLDALNLQQDMNKFQATSLASLHKTVTAKHTNESIDRDQAAPKPGGIPTNFDSGGEHFEIDPTQTTVMGQTRARTALGPIRAAISIGDKLLAVPTDHAPTNFGYLKNLLGLGGKDDNTARETINAQIASMRNQSASAFKESMSQEAANERAKGLYPDLPKTDAGMAQWHAAIKEGVQVAKDYDAEVLHNAGAHRAGPTRDKTVPTGESRPAPDHAAPKGKMSIDDLVKAAGGR
jgi:hypothetical protein